MMVPQHGLLHHLLILLTLLSASHPLTCCYAQSPPHQGDGQQPPLEGNNLIFDGAGASLSDSAASASVSSDAMVTTADIHITHASGGGGAAANSMGSGSGQEPALIASLLAWLESRGWQAPTDTVKVFIQPNTTLVAAGRSRADLSLRASRFIAEGETVFELPLALGVTASQLAEAETEAQAGGSTPRPHVYDGEVLPFTSLTAWLLRERAAGASSPFLPFLRLLPDHLPFPYLFSDTLLAEMQEELVIMEVQENKKPLIEEFKRSNREAVANASLSDFMHAWGLVTSRALPIPLHSTAGKGEGEGDGEDYVLMPFADLLNHGEPGNVAYKLSASSPSGASLVFVATANISEGEELQRHYGQLTNEEAAMMYGFVPHSNVRSNMALFHTPEQAAKFYHKHVLIGDAEWTHNYAIVDSMHVVEEFIESELRKRRYRDRLHRVEYQFRRDRPLFAWWGGRVDPRLLGGFAVIHATMVNRKPFEYEDVAKAAVLYGWMRNPKTTCDDMASWMDDQVSDSIPSAGQAIAARASQLLAAFPTKISEDLRLLEALYRCRERASNNDVALEDLADGASLAERLDKCALEVVSDLPSIELVLIARLSKKAVLSQLIDRLVHTCEN